MADISNVTGNLDILGTLSALPGMSTVINLGKVAIIVVIVYVVFLIIRSIMQIRYAFSMNRLIKTVEEINRKMDSLAVGKTKKK
jgi:hypothetical protein